MRFFFIAIVAISVGCAHQAENLRISYSIMDQIGQTPRLVEIASGAAIISPGEVDLLRTSQEERSEIVFAALKEAQAYALENQLDVLGPPLLVNRVISPVKWRFEVMLPIGEGRDAAPQGPIALGYLPSGLAAAMDHHGDQETLSDSYRRLESLANRVQLLDLTWEQYLTAPGATAPEDQRIRVFRAAAPK
jgi:hypothetical protein